MRVQFNVSTFVKRIWRSVLAFAGLFLGFNSQVAAQYGVVETVYKINGNVASYECKTPIKGINIDLQEITGDREISYSGQNILSDSSGNFSFYLYGYHGVDRIKLQVKDIDGSNYGTYRDTVFVLPAGMGDFRKTDVGNWHINYEYGKTIQFMLQTSGIPPCKEEPLKDDTLSRALIPPIKVEGSADEKSVETSVSIINAEVPEIHGNSWHEPDAVDHIKLFPNPVAGQLIIEFISNENDVAALRVYNEGKQLIYSETIELTEGSNTIKIETFSFSPGPYLLRIDCRKTSYSKKFVHL